MKNFTSLAALVAVSTNLLIGCVAGDNLPPPDDDVVQPEPEPTKFARTCAEIAKLNPTVADGEFTLYIANDESKPWTAYCDDLRGTATEYLTVDGAMNWSSFRAGGSTIGGTDVETRFDKVRIDPTTLRLDIGDQTFAISTGAIALVGGEATSMPLGVAMTCGGGYATAQVSITGTPFVLQQADFAIAGDAGNTGNADLWSTNKTVEMWADGDCGWVGPTAAPARPMNKLGGFAISLTYQK